MFSAAARAWLARICSVTLSIAIARSSALPDEMEIAMRVDRSGEAGRDADRRVLLCDHRGTIQAVTVLQRLAPIERQVLGFAVIPDVDAFLRHRFAGDLLLFDELGARSGAGDHQAQIDDLDLGRFIAKIVEQRVLAMNAAVSAPISPAAIQRSSI